MVCPLFHPGALRWKQKHARAPDAQDLICVEIGQGDHQPGAMAGRDEDHVGPARAHIPGAVAWLQAAARREAHTAADRTPEGPDGTDHEAKTDERD